MKALITCPERKLAVRTRRLCDALDTLLAALDTTDAFDTEVCRVQIQRSLIESDLAEVEAAQ